MRACGMLNLFYLVYSCLGLTRTYRIVRCSFFRRRAVSEGNEASRVLSLLIDAYRDRELQARAKAATAQLSSHLLDGKSLAACESDGSIVLPNSNMVSMSASASELTFPRKRQRRSDDRLPAGDGSLDDDNDGDSDGFHDDDVDDVTNETDFRKVFEEGATPFRLRLIKKQIWGGNERDTDAHQADVRSPLLNDEPQLARRRCARCVFCVIR